MGQDHLMRQVQSEGWVTMSRGRIGIEGVVPPGLADLGQELFLHGTNNNKNDNNNSSKYNNDTEGGKSDGGRDIDKISEDGYAWHGGWGGAAKR